MKRKYLIVSIIVILLALVQGGLLVVLRPVNPVETVIKNNDYLFSYTLDQEFFDDAYDQAGDVQLFSEKPYGVIVPHHLFVKGKLAAIFNSLGKFNYKRIIILSPNHFDRGYDNFISAENDWQTPYGAVVFDYNLYQRLNKKIPISSNKKALTGEHGISGLIAFVKKSLPEAKIVPIMVMNNESSAMNAESLARAIEELTDKDTLVIASVDFSHEQNLTISNQQDEISIRVLQKMDIDQVADLKLDSPNSIKILLQYLKMRGVNQSRLIYHTNTSELLNQPAMPGTSHVFMVFFKNKE